jgi:hypothetical protein
VIVRIMGADRPPHPEHSSDAPFPEREEPRDQQAVAYVWLPVGEGQPGIYACVLDAHKSVLEQVVGGLRTPWQISERSCIPEDHGRIELAHERQAALSEAQEILRQAAGRGPSETLP